MAYKDPNDERAKAAKRRYYEKNKAEYLARNLKNKQRNQQFLLEYLKTHPCVDCGESDVRCLQFDHRDRELKVFNIGRAVSDGFSIEKIQAEIDKCDVRCANCHSKRTCEQFSWYKM
jgi:hypothetical protein